MTTMIDCSSDHLRLRTITQLIQLFGDRLIEYLSYGLWPIQKDYTYINRSSSEDAGAKLIRKSKIANLSVRPSRIFAPKTHSSMRCDFSISANQPVYELNYVKKNWSF